jgi:uncharacterized protein (DUF169 family)
MQDEDKNSVKANKRVISFNRSANRLLSQAYQLKYFPVAIKFVKKGEKVFSLPRAKQRHSVCAHLRAAAQGESFLIDKESISCPGGLRWLGFSSPLAKTFLYKYFLGEIERAKSSPEIAERCLDFLPGPPKEGQYECLLFGPLLTCQFEPDVVVLITSPKHAYRVVVVAYLDEYHLVKTIPLCAACHGAISIPFTSGELNVSLIDPVARELGGYKDDEVLVGLGRPRFESLVDNLKETPFGVRKEPLLARIVVNFLKRLMPRF